ncbi:MAG: peroxiredoxin-like family protein [Chitinophagaceae bacterium]
MQKVFLVTIFTLILAVAKTQPTIYPEGLKAGDNAPQIQATDNGGHSFDLKKQLKKGDVVLLFYRGQWCPYCNRQLSQLNDSLAMIIAKGASVIAVSPEVMENVAKTVGKTKASFPIISDSNLAIMKAYQVNFAVDENTQTKYKKFGIDFGEANGSNGANLPVPATYVIGKNGKIKWVFFNPVYTKRPSVQDILDHL